MAESPDVIWARIDQRLGFLINSHNELKEEIRPVIDDVKKIKIHLYKDDLTGNDGLISRVDNHSKIIAQMQQDRAMDKKVTSVWAAMIAGAATVIWNLVKWLWF